MSKRKRRRPPPAEEVMRNAGPHQKFWSLEKHLTGCLAAYQDEPSYGRAVYFALEALSGIARDVEFQAEANALADNIRDPDWIMQPRATVPVPWIWVRALAHAWGRYLSEDGPLGTAFGLEGGQGKRPLDSKLAQILDERAIARWVWDRIQNVRSTGQAIRIEDAIQDAAEHFGKSDVTVRRAWKRHAKAERARTAHRVMTLDKS